MNVKLAIFVELCLALVCVGCFGGHPQVINENISEVQTTPPDSLKAKMDLELYDAEGALHELSGVLFAVPEKRYRLELTGPIGIGVASLLWLPEKWTFIFPTEKKYIEGNGYWVGDLQNRIFPVVDIHQVAGFFWGSLLPQKATIEREEDSLDWVLIHGKDTAQLAFTAAKEKSTGRIIWVERGNSERVTFQEFMSYDGRILPSEIAFFRGKTCFLKLHVKSVKTKVSWGEDVWHLEVPENYHPLEE